MTRLNRAVGVVLAAAVMGAIVWASNAPLPVHRSSDGVLRLAWSALPERLEKCRQRTNEELAQLPQHMRQPILCEGATAEYRLQVHVNGVLAADRIVRGGGWRRDRRLYVFEEIPLRAREEAAIGVRLDRVDSTDADAAAAQTRPPGPGNPLDPPRLVESVPPHLSLQRRLSVAPRAVILVTYDRDRRELTTLREQTR